jgi:methionyl aminopeptidase
MPKLKSPQDMQKMREAGRLAAETLRYIGEKVVAGMSTEMINTLVHNYIIEHGAYPSPLKYKGFPKSVCTSINHVICHGIPSETEILEDGDIVNIDITVTLNGYFGDTSRTFYVGGKDKAPPDRVRVTEVAEESLARAMAVTKHGARLGDIGHAIQSYAEAKECSVVRDFVGHGIGKVFHEDPQIQHFGKAGSGDKIIRGMCFTIEPMINAGDWKTKILKDGWTAITTDGKPSAQFEHTFAIVGDGIEVMTALPDDPIVKRARELGANILWPEVVE